MKELERKLRYSLKITIQYTKEKVYQKIKTTPNLNQTPDTQLKILTFSSINLYGFSGINEFNRSDPDTCTWYTSSMTSHMLQTPLPPPNYILGNTDSCVDNIKCILLSLVLKCLLVALTVGGWGWKSVLCIFHKR